MTPGKAPSPHRSSLLALTLLFALLTLTPLHEAALAQFQPGERVASFTAQIVPTGPRAGESVRLVIEAEIDEGWHIYSVMPQGEDAPPPSSLELSEAKGGPLPLETDGPLYETKPTIKYDAAIGLTLAYHEHRARFYQNLTIPKKAAPGELALKAEIGYQACDDRVCLPPVTETIELNLTLTEGPTRTERTAPDRSIDPLPGTDFERAKAKGFWGFIALAALMGLASLLTPCVFPMIPITVSYFSKQAEGDHKRLIKLSIWFALGIIGTYTGTGLIMAGLFGAGAAIQLASNPWVNLAIAGLFILFALSLMGLFEINLPQGVSTYFDSKARRMGGVLGVVLMGFTFTLTAFTCTVQFVGTLLIAAAAGEWLWPLVGMLVFSTVFAFPFFLLAISPGLIRRMQGKSGDWMGRSKMVLGILELMASIKFLSNADLVWQSGMISRDTNLYLWMGLLGLIVSYLSVTAKKSRLQWFFAGVFALLLFASAQGLGDRSLGSLTDSLLPPPSGLSKIGGDSASKEEIESLLWHDDLDQALKLAKDQNKRIFLEFTGYTCVNCRWMDQNLLAKKPIHRRLRDDFVLVKLYTDGGEHKERNMNLQIERFKTVALPYYVTLSPEGQVQGEFMGIARSMEEYEEFLEQR